MRPSPDPGRRSSLDETPLPRPVPHHVHDPTSQPMRVSAAELTEVDDLPPTSDPRGSAGGGSSGLAQAARRISGLIAGTGDDELDVSAELDTRQRPRVDADALRKISRPPPTVPVERVDSLDAADESDVVEPSEVIDPADLFEQSGVDDFTAPRPRDSENEMTNPHDRGDRDSDDEF